MGPRSPGDAGGVDLYVGGVEHAVLHLLYARFWHKVLFDLGHVSSAEPFRRLFNQGYISAYAYTDERGFYVPGGGGRWRRDGAFFYEGEPVNREYGKMGKSLKNSVTPDEMYDEYGADTLRLYEMSTGPLDQSRPWETQAVVGCTGCCSGSGASWSTRTPAPCGGRRRAGRRRPCGRCTGPSPPCATAWSTLRFNIAIARLIELNNHLTAAYGAGSPVPRSVVEPLVLLVAPLAPHVAEELWARLGHDGVARLAPVPGRRRALAGRGHRRGPGAGQRQGAGAGQVPADADAAALEAAARADEKVAAYLDGRDRAPRRRRARPPGQLRRGGDPRRGPASVATPSGHEDGAHRVLDRVATSATVTSRPSSADSEVTPASADAARDHVGERGHVRVAVELEAVHRDARGHPDADGGDLALGPAPSARHPHAAAALDPAVARPEAGADFDQRLLDRAARRRRRRPGRAARRSGSRPAAPVRAR